MMSVVTRHVTHTHRLARAREREKSRGGGVDVMFFPLLFPLCDLATTTIKTVWMLKWCCLPSHLVYHHISKHTRTCRLLLLPSLLLPLLLRWHFQVTWPCISTKVGNRQGFLSCLPCCFPLISFSFLFLLLNRCSCHDISPYYLSISHPTDTLV